MMIDIEIDRTASGIRQFPLAYRVEFVQRWDDAIERGAKTRLLREHNLTRCTIRRWLAARDAGEYDDQRAAEREERSRNRMDNADRAELARLRKKNKDLEHRLAQSEAVREILGKAYELLDGITTSSRVDEQDPEIPVALLSADEYDKWLARHKLL